MKVIDLLNKIANGEEVPTNIIYKDEMFRYIEGVDYCSNEDNDYLLENEPITEEFLNCEVTEIIEEDKKIEKLREPLLQEETLNYVKLLKSKINEIIDQLNEMNDK